MQAAARLVTPRHYQEPLRVQVAHAPPELGAASPPEPATLALAVQKLG